MISTEESGASPFTIELNQDQTSFQPGDKIAGVAKWSGMAGTTTSIEIRLLWVTSGKGDQDLEVVDLEKIEHPSSSGETPFGFTAPEFPNSIAGKLVSIGWVIEMIAFPNREGESIEIVIGPGGEAIKVSNNLEVSSEDEPGW